MRDTLMDESQVRPIRPVSYKVWSMVAVPAVLLLCAGQRRARSRDPAVEALYRRGVEVFNLTEDSDHREDDGRERKQIRSETIDFTWNVTEVGPSGDAVVVKRIDHVSMKVEAPPFMPFEFDSNTPNAEVPEPFELEVRQLKAVAGSEFSFKMKSSGEITDVTIPPATLKRLREALPAEQVEKGEFSEQGMKDVLMHSSPPPFPLTPVEPGKSWSSKPSKMVLQFGTLVPERILTYQGPDRQNPRLLIIAQESKVTLQPVANVEIKIRSQEGKGTLSFDSKAGCVVNSRSTEKMEISASIMGQQVDRTTEMTETWTLVP